MYFNQSFSIHPLISILFRQCIFGEVIFFPSINKFSVKKLLNRQKIEGKAPIKDIDHTKAIFKLFH